MDNSTEFRDLNWYKSNISLPDFLMDVYGFEETSKSSRQYPKLRDPKILIM
ncbi:MAG: hypothetical protein HC831_20455 [Chloroflexia bacterium]|nr:hypothetical protein [Chloroflexia bacterium]